MQNPSLDDSLFRQIVETSAEGVWVVDLRSKTVFVNECMAKFLGYPRAEMTGRNFPDFLHPDDEPRARQNFERRKAGDTRPQEYRFIHKNGETIWLSITASPFRDQAGEVCGLVAFCTDIAERKKVDELIRKERDRATSILESTSDAFIAFDRDWTITDLNAQAERLTSQSRTELIGKDFRNEFPEAPGSKFDSKYIQARDEGVPVRFEEFYPPLNTWFAVQAYPCPSDGGVAIYFQNITDRKRNEREREQLNAQLESERALLREVLQQLPAGVVIAEAGTGRVLLANDQVEKILRHQAIYAPDIAGYSRYGAIHPEDGSPYKEDEYPLVRSLLYGTVTTSEEQTYIRGDGSVAKLIVSATPVYDSNGRATSCVAVFSDISSIKAMEAALRRANGDLEQFAYAAAHDLQEPVRNMSLFAEFLERELGDTLEGRTKGHLTVITDSAKRIQALINDLLRYTRVLADGDHTSGPPCINASDVVAEVVSVFRDRLERAEAAVSVAALPCVGVERTHLFQIFQNLISNALKYRGKNAPRINISAEPQGHEWNFRVQDNGPGIAPEYRGRIFEVFKRLHGREVPGTGIGLSICQRIVNHYNGRIWVESNESGGATFCFTLPSARELPGSPSPAPNHLPSR